MTEPGKAADSGQRLSQRLESLSQEQRALLAMRLRGKNLLQPTQATIPRATQRSFFPLSFAQERLWFLYQLQPENTDYNICSAIRLKGMISETALKQTLYEIVRRHEILRTTFEYVDGQPMQKVGPAGAIRFLFIDLQQFSPERQEREIKRLAVQDARCPFDLNRGPVIRYALLRTNMHECVLIQTMHHIVCDGWSMRLLIEEFITIYTAYIKARSGARLALPAEPASQYGDFALWQRERLQGRALDADIHYWKKQLAGYTRLQFPPHYRSTSSHEACGARQFFEIPASTTEVLRELSQSADVTIFMTLLAGLQTLLMRLTAQDDICVGITVANRTRAEVKHLVGFLVNILLLRTDLSGNPTFRELLQRVRAVTLEAYSHQELPFDKLVAFLDPERSKDSTPLVTVGFDYQKDKKQILKLPDIQAEFLPLENGRPQFDLTLRITDEEYALCGRLDYDVRLFKDTVIQTMLTHYCTLLREVAADPELHILDIPLVDKGQLRNEQVATHLHESANLDYFDFETDLEGQGFS